jgi:general secretion pathway protein G
MVSPSSRSILFPARKTGRINDRANRPAAIEDDMDSSEDAPMPVQQAGFTLLEILVGIAILGLLIGLVAPAVLRQLGGARVSIAHQSIARLGSVLDMYKLDVGSYPSTEDGLAALVHRPSGVSNWNGPYTQSPQVPTDPWGHDYVYRDPSQRAGHDYDLCSMGPTGQATGDDMIWN